MLPKLVQNIVDDMVSDFMYYDRKGDDELGVEEIKRLFKSGEMKVEDVVARFEEQLRACL